MAHDLLRHLASLRAHGEWADTKLVAAAQLVAGDATVVLRELAHVRGAQEVVLAWLLATTPVMIPIPGATKPATVDSIVRSLSIVLTADQKARLDETHPEMASILVTHHLEELPTSTTHALLIANGRTVASGAAVDTVTTATGAYGDKAAYNPNTGKAAVQTTNPYNGVKTTQTNTGVTAKSKNGYGVAQGPGGKTCVKGHGNAGCN